MHCLDLRIRELLLAAVATAGVAGCTTPYGGSNLQFDFSGSVLVPSGTVDDGPHVPENSYFTFYGTDEVLDESGAVADTYSFAVARFEIREVIDVSSPCFIELDDAKFPGVHVTRVAQMLRKSICDRLGLAEDCFASAYNPPSGATDGDVTDVLGADLRMAHLPQYQGALRAIATSDDFAYPAAQAGCSFSGDQLPAPTCIDATSNAQRLRVCKQIWAANPDHYEGSDKVFTLPLNGQFWGMVNGSNPTNGAPLGGGSMFVDTELSGFESYEINWQFKDLDGDGSPDYPADFFDDNNADGQPDHQESLVGYPYLSGRPVSRTRGVINAHLTNPFDTNIFAEIAIFPHLAEDDVTF